MRVYVAVPCLDKISARFAQCIADLESPKDTDVKIHYNIGTLVYDSRDSLAEKAIGSRSEYTFWLDSDMTFMPDTLVMMLDTMQKENLDILVGMYYRRRHPFTPTLFKRFDISPTAGIRQEEFDEIPNGLFKVAACGFGCVLMKTDVLMNVLVKHGAMFSPINKVGEDISFCVRARQCGYDIWCDPSIALGHEVHTIITRSNRSQFIHGQ